MMMAFAVFCVFSQIQSSSGQEPTCSLIPGVTQYDVRIDDLISGTKSSVSIRVVNSTEQPLSVKEIRSSCGCLGGKLDPNTIPSGKSAALELTVSTSATAKEFTNQLKFTLENNDEIFLNIRSKLRRIVEVAPASILAVGEKEVTLHATPGYSITSVKAVPSARFIRHVAVNSSSEDGRTVKCTIQFSERASSLSAKIMESLIVECVDTRQNEKQALSVEVELRPTSPIIISPSDPVFSLSSGEANQLFVIKSSVGVENLKVVSVVDGKEVPVKIEVLKESPSVVIAKVSLREDVSGNGVLKFSASGNVKEVGFSVLSKKGTE